MALRTGTSILVVGDRHFDWGDLKAAAVLWGDWQRAERQAREGLACLRFIEADERELDDAIVQAAADDFRQERNLIAAEDMNGWLEARGLEVDEWLGFVERSVARGLHAAELHEIAAGYPVDDEEIAAVVDCEAICSGILADTARKLAAAAAFAAGQDGLATSVETVAGLRAAFDVLRASVLTEEGIERAIASHGLGWITIDCWIASFPNGDSAREAALCVREGSEDLAAVARSAGTRAERRGVVLEDLDSELQTRLLSAEEGALVGPVDLHGQPSLVLVIAKSRPHAADPRLRSRVEQVLLAAAIERETLGRARFLLEI